MSSRSQPHGPRSGPIEFNELGARLGEKYDFRGLEPLEQTRQYGPILERLLEVLAQVRADGGPATAVADLLEKIGEARTTEWPDTDQPEAGDEVDTATAASCWEAALAIRTAELGECHADTCWTRHLLAMWYANIRVQTERGVELLEANVACGPDALPPARELQRVSLHAALLRLSGRPAEALAPLERAVALLAGAADADPVELGRAHATLGGACFEAERRVDAQQHFDRALAVLDAAMPRSAAALARTAHEYAHVLGASGDLEAAELRHQLHVVVSLRNGMIPMGRGHARPTTDQHEAIQEIWDRHSAATPREREVGPHGRERHASPVVPAHRQAAAGWWCRVRGWFRS